MWGCRRASNSSHDGEGRSAASAHAWACAGALCIIKLTSACVQRIPSAAQDPTQRHGCADLGGWMWRVGIMRGREVGRKARKMRSVTAVHLSHARGVNEERNFKQASWCAGAVGSWRKRCSARVGTRRPGCGNGRLSYPRVTTCAGFDPWVRNCGLKKAFQVFE